MASDEWGVRITVGGSPSEHACESEEAARASVAALRERHADWNAELLFHVPAGPWEVIDGG